MMNNSFTPDKAADKTGKAKKRDMPSVRMLENELNREKQKKTYRQAVRTTVYAMIVAAAAAVLVAVLALPVFRIYGSSMTPTLYEGDIVIAFSNHKFATGDLVGFYHGNKLLVKRCIAGPGEMLSIDADGNVFVDGKKLNEPYVSQKSLGECDIKMPYQIPENKWFFMGDHREVSFDSRVSAIGCIDKDQVKGKVLFRIWPLSRFGSVK